MALLPQIVLSVSAGMGAAAVAAYRDWRQTRLVKPAHLRNGRFVNDRSVRWLHLGLVGIVAAFVAWLVIFMLMFTGVIPERFWWLFDPLYGP